MSNPGKSIQQNRPPDKSQIKYHSIRHQKAKITSPIQKIKSRTEPLPSHKLHSELSSRKCHKLFNNQKLSFIFPVCNTSTTETNIPSANRISLATVNAWSIYSKKEDFQEYLLSNDLDICLVTETWLKHLDTHTENEVPLPNYNIISQTRSVGRTGGGLALVYKNNPKIKITKHQQHDSQPDIAEIHSFNITIHQMPISLYVVYRIPNSSVISFCETLSNILTENIVTNHARPILLGDFNIHIDCILAFFYR